MIRQTHQTTPKKLAPASRFTRTRAADFTSLCIRNVSAFNLTIAESQQSRSLDCPWSTGRESRAKNILPICVLRQDNRRAEGRHRTDRRASSSSSQLPKSRQIELGLLFNFGHYPKLQYERIVKTQLNRNLMRRFTSKVLASFSVFGGQFCG